MTNTKVNKPLILIADDDLTVRIMLQETLESYGFDVITTKNGIEAQKYHQNKQPDALILDIQMPGKDGLTLCSEIRNSKGGEFIPILISTGLDDRQSIEDAYEKGATDFIVKPINWAIIGHRMQYILRSGKAIKQYILEQQWATNLWNIVNNSSNEIFIIDGYSLKIIKTNSSAIKNLSYNVDEIIGLRFTDILPDISKEQFMLRISPLLLPNQN